MTARTPKYTPPSRVLPEEESQVAQQVPDYITATVETDRGMQALIAVPLGKGYAGKATLVIKGRSYQAVFNLRES